MNLESKITQRNVISFSAVLILLASYFSLGFNNADEHFQILEFAKYKLGERAESTMPWELHERLRSTIQPAMVVHLHKFSALFGTQNPFLISMVLRFLSGALSFLSIFMIYKALKIKDEQFQSWYLLFSFLLWFLIYNAVRFSSETWSGRIFGIAIALFFLQKSKKWWHPFLLGLLLGLAFLFRYQVGFMILGFGLWLLFIRKEGFLNLVLIAFGILQTILIGILIDYWFYGEWVFTIWNYFEQNLIQGKAATFGTEPWWYYFNAAMEKMAHPIGIPLILSILTFIFVRRKSLVTWIIFPFLMIHFLIGHKELRFLYPIIIFLPYILVDFVSILKKKIGTQFLKNKFFRIYLNLFLITNFILALVATFRPADDQISLYKAVYKFPDQPIKLYYLNENPYGDFLNIHYYKPKNLKTVKITTLDTNFAKTDTLTLLTFRREQKPKSISKNYNKIYASYPEWIGKLNFNGWLDRTDFWYIYEVRNSGD